MEVITKSRLALSSLTVYRGILSDKTVSEYMDLLETAHGVDIRSFFDAYGAFFNSLMAKGAASLPEYLGNMILYDDNIFSRQAAASGRESVAPELFRAAENDLALLKKALLTAAEIKHAASENFECDDGEIEKLLENLPEWRGGELINNDAARLCEFYKENGCGIYARFSALRWERGGLHGLLEPDPVRLCSLKGYDYERGVVIENTLEFLDGSKANNMLLYGDRGTGKSSTVKAVCNEYAKRGLRIIEVPKDSIADFSGITEKIADLPLKFIIFIDDLSFANDDDNYAALKGVLEGGLSVRPANTVIYATSNRRHFVKESFAEREGDDVHAADAMQEKLSLADRFGITVTFSSPDQRLYLEIVNRLAEERALEISREKLERGALQWALMYNGRSPRTARQYVDWAQARLKSGRDFEI